MQEDAEHNLGGTGRTGTLTIDHAVGLTILKIWLQCVKIVIETPNIWQTLIKMILCEFLNWESYYFYCIRFHRQHAMYLLPEPVTSKQVLTISPYWRANSGPINLRCNDHDLTWQLPSLILIVIIAIYPAFDNHKNSVISKTYLHTFR